VVHQWHSRPGRREVLEDHQWEEWEDRQWEEAWEARQWEAHQWEAEAHQWEAEAPAMEVLHLAQAMGDHLQDMVVLLDIEWRAVLSIVRLSDGIINTCDVGVDGVLRCKHRMKCYLP